MNRPHRIVALLGVALIAVSIVCMLLAGFLPQARDVLFNITLMTFVAALAILVFLSVIRKRKAEEQKDHPEENAEN